MQPTNHSNSTTNVWGNVPMGADLSDEETAARLDAVQEDPVLRIPVRTALGRELKRLRAEYLAKGGQLSTVAEVRREVRERRGDQFEEE